MMTRSTPDPARSRRPVRAAFAVAFIALVAGLYSCAPKITKVDTRYSMPEGVVSSDASLLLWYDQPTTVAIYADVAPADPDPNDVLMRTETYQRYDAQTLHGLIIDRTQADAFQLFRREPGGGVRQFANYAATRTRAWLASQYEAYHFIDPSPSGYSPPTYVCRGVVEGVVNATSPLTNVATPALSGIANISSRAVWWNNTDITRGPVFRSPKIKLKWDAVPGAARYLLQVYEFRSDLRSEQERILSGTPAPIYDGQSTDIYFGYLPGNIDFLFIGDSTRTDLTTIQARPLASGSQYVARLTAFDASDRIIGFSLGEPNIVAAYLNGTAGIQRGVDGNNTYMLYRYGGALTRDTVVAAGG
jgi:hypothetical protein